MDKDFASLKAIADEYFFVVQSEDTEKILEYLYPRLFEILPKEKMLEAMEIGKDTSKKLTTTTFSTVYIDDIQPIIELKGIKYTLLSYSFTIDIAFPLEKVEAVKLAFLQEDEIQESIMDLGYEFDYHNVDFGDEMEEEKTPEQKLIKLLKFNYEMFQAFYGQENVKFDMITKTLSVKINSQMFCILDSVYGTWKFIGKKEHLLNKLIKILPAKIVKKFFRNNK